MSYLEAQAAGGFLLAPVAHFQTNLVVRELSGAAIAGITTAIINAPATCKVIIVPLRGAVTRVGVSDTAFALREPGYEVDITSPVSGALPRRRPMRCDRCRLRATACSDLRSIKLSQNHNSGATPMRTNTQEGVLSIYIAPIGKRSRANLQCVLLMGTTRSYRIGS